MQKKDIMTTRALVPQQSGDLAADIMEDFGRFLRLHTADGDASPATLQSYYGNEAQFVAWCGEHGINQRPLQRMT